MNKDKLTLVGFLVLGFLNGIFAINMYGRGHLITAAVSAIALIASAFGCAGAYERLRPRFFYDDDK